MAAITYLMGKDSGGNDYFSNARGYFDQTADMTFVEPTGAATYLTLDDVLKDLRVRTKDSPPSIYSVVNLVTHASGFSSLQFPISAARVATDGDLVTADILTTALTKAGTDGYPNKAGTPAVTKDTKVCLYGCDVGRDAGFVRDLGLMFGDDLTIYAPLRIAVFRHSGTTFQYRLGRTWTVNFTSDVNKATNWAATRTAYLAVAVPKFQTKAAKPTDTDPIKTAAAAATHTTAASFFFSESMETGDDPATTTIAGASAVLPSGTLDDTTVPITVASKDFKPVPGQPGAWVAWIAVLGSVLEDAVSLDTDTQYRKVVLTGGKVASPGPKPAGGGAPPPPPAPGHAGLFGTARDAFVAAGGQESSLDDLIAGILESDGGTTDFDLTQPDLAAVEDGRSDLDATSFG